MTVFLEVWGIATMLSLLLYKGVINHMILADGYNEFEFKLSGYNEPLLNYVYLCANLLPVIVAIIWVIILFDRSGWDYKLKNIKIWTLPFMSMNTAYRAVKKAVPNNDIRQHFKTDFYI